MERYQDMIDQLLVLAKRDDTIQAIIAIGSQTREAEKADEYSDLDLMIVSRKPEEILDDDSLLSNLGNIKISFIEDTIGGAKERRVLFEGSLDVDLIVLSPEQYLAAANQFIDEMMDRGHKILYNNMQAAEMISDMKPGIHMQKRIPEREFLNLVNDFWFHTVWASKKLRRGELWTAKMCVDCYLKRHLLRIIELYEVSKHGGDYDMWHSGRLLEKWAEPFILEELKKCFATFDETGMQDALIHTAELFGRLAREASLNCGYFYPETAESYAKTLL